MRLRTLIGYLCGSKGAIQQIAANPQALWIGLLFVLSAGFAREYDGEDLLHEPWHVLIPLAASLVSSFTLYFMAYALACWKNDFTLPFFAGYRSFLGLFWMTAPLAWLYAIPYELGPSVQDATTANLLTLGAVSVWRVVLMTRVLSVLFDWRPVDTGVIVLGFANLFALGLAFVTGMPLTRFFLAMGGVRMAPSEALVSDAGCCLIQLSVCTVPIFLISMSTVRGPGKGPWPRLLAEAPSSQSSNWQLWVLAGVSLAVWPFILPSTQGPQQLRYAVERDLKNGRIAEALAEMSVRSPEEFPRHWDPPPRGLRGKNPHILDVMETMLDHPPAPWVREIYVEKYDYYVNYNSTFMGEFWHNPGHLRRAVVILFRLPEGPELVGRRDFRASQLRGLIERNPEINDEISDVIVCWLEEAEEREEARWSAPARTNQPNKQEPGQQR